MNKITNTFKQLLLLSSGKSIGNIRPYRLKSSPNFLAGFEKLTPDEAKREGIIIPENHKQGEPVYIMRIGPAIFRDWIPAWMFEPVFEPVPEKTEKDMIHTLTEEIQSHFDSQTDLNKKAYALSVELIKKCDGSIHDIADDERDPSTYIPLVDVDPVLFIITEASLNGSEQIVLNGHGYYSGIEYEWTCYDTTLGMDILNFVLLYYKEQEIQ